MQDNPFCLTHNLYHQLLDRFRLRLGMIRDIMKFTHQISKKHQKFSSQSAPSSGRIILVEPYGAAFLNILSGPVVYIDGRARW